MGEAQDSIEQKTTARTYAEQWSIAAMRSAIEKLEAVGERKLTAAGALYLSNLRSAVVLREQGIVTTPPTDH